MSYLDLIPRIQVNIKTRGLLIAIVSGFMVVTALLDPDFFNVTQLLVTTPHHEQLFVVLGIIDVVLLFVKDLHNQFVILQIMLLILGVLFLISMAYHA